MKIFVGFSAGATPHVYENATASVKDGTLRIETSLGSVTYATHAWSWCGENQVANQDEERRACAKWREARERTRDETCQ
jgi:hypothetical protein